jgi:hypothetical protein
LTGNIFARNILPGNILAGNILPGNILVEMFGQEIF